MCVLVQIIDDREDSENLFIVMEYCEGGPILSTDNPVALPEHTARSYFR